MITKDDLRMLLVPEWAFDALMDNDRLSKDEALEAMRWQAAKMGYDDIALVSDWRARFRYLSDVDPYGILGPDPRRGYLPFWRCSDCSNTIPNDCSSHYCL